MANLSQLKRERLLEFLEKLKNERTDDDSLRAINEIETHLLEKKYGLVWEEHSEQVDEMLQHNIPVFTEVEERKIEADSKLPYNFLLEGDNLHSLKLLEKTHKGKIDVIYIDPPYNTGKKDFVYDDCYIDNTDGYRHSKWLSFMNKRLNIAKDLLAENGVMFISIDDNEQAQLKMLCDDVFGELNFIAMPIHKNNSNKNQSKLIGVSTEYVLVYAKKIDFLRVNEGEWRLKKSGARDVAKKFNQLKSQGLSLDEIEQDIKDMYKRPKYSHLSRWNKVDDKGVYKDSDLSRANGSKDYTIINPNTGKPVMIPERGWGKSYDELLRLQRENLIWYGDPKTPPGMKLYIEEDTESVVDSFWYYDNSIDTKFLRNMFGEDVFNNPKPQAMIEDILSLISKPYATVLDFFAGSGTTGHAVVQLNKEDGGSRKYILCTNNENNICEEVTYQRLKNIQNELPHNLKYYKTDFIPKFAADETLVSVKMLNHVKELIELENACEVDGVNNAIIINEEQLNEWLKKPIKNANLFISSNLLLNAEQSTIVEKEEITVINIPEYYFKSELKEAGES